MIVFMFTADGSGPYTLSFDIFVNGICLVAQYKMFRC